MSYEDLEVQWIETLGDEDVEDDEWVPVDDESSDSKDVFKKDECVVLEKEELGTIVDESKITKMLDDFEVDETIFR